MRVLNLTDVEASEIKYTISRFPDGQQQVAIKILEKELIYSDLHPIGGASIKSWEYPVVQIKARLNNFQDLELIICATKSLRNLGVKKIHLYTPYFLGSRSDRQFEEGGNNYLKDVICPIINSLNFKSVTVLDPHSDVLEACLNNFNKDSNIKLIVHSLGKIYKDLNLNQFILVSPDAGANKKIYKLAKQIGYEGDIITCSKERNTSGELVETTVPIRQRHQGKDIIIIDDICDGGATFINIAKSIKEDKFFKDCKIYLIVTHGIFSKGFIPLAQYFDGIFCTNSYKNIELSSSFYETYNIDPKFVQQLKVI